jgi:hypothetical protein
MPVPVIGYDESLLLIAELMARYLAHLLDYVKNRSLIEYLTVLYFTIVD